MAMKLVKKTAEYSIFKRSDDRYAVKDANKQPVNGDEKVRILVAEELVKVALPAEPEPEPEEAVEEEAAAEEAPAEEEASAEEEAPAAEEAVEPEEPVAEEAPAEEASEEADEEKDK